MIRIILSVLVNLFIPGLGQFINDQRIKGTLFVLAYLVFLSIPMSFVTLMGMSLFILVAIVDALIVSIQIYKGKREARADRSLYIEVIGVALVTIVFIILIAIFIRDSGGEDLVLPEINNKSTVEKIDPQEESRLIKETEDYLTEKYGKAFEIESVKYLKRSQAYIIEAYPQEKPDLRFRVTKDSKGYQDTYVATGLTDEVNQITTPVLKELYPEHSSYLGVVGLDQSYLDQVGKDIPSIDELKDEKDKYTYKLSVYVIKNMEGVQREEELKKIGRLISFLQKEGIQTRLRIQYYNETLLTKGVNEVSLANSFQNSGELSYIFEVYNTDQIGSKEDIVNNLRKIKR